MRGLRGPPGRRHDRVAEFGQQRDGDAADAAVGAGHQDFAVGRLDAVLLEGQNAEHGGVAGSADGHRLAGGEGGGQRHQPIALDPRHLGQAAAMRFADAPAVEHHLVAGCPRRIGARGHRTGEIDARHHRKTAHDRRLAGDRQAVLVVERRPFDPHGDVALGQHGLVDLLQLCLVAGLVLGDQDALEHVDSPFARWVRALTITEAQEIRRPAAPCHRA